MGKLVNLNDRAVEELDRLRYRYKCSYSKAVLKMAQSTTGAPTLTAMREHTETVARIARQHPKSANVRDDLEARIDEFVREGARLRRTLSEADREQEAF